MTKIYKDLIPVGANITIDYKSNRRVVFSYPKEQSYEEALRGLTLSTWIFFLGIISFYFIFSVVIIFIIFSILSIFLPIFMELAEGIIILGLIIFIIWVIGGIIYYDIKSKNKEWIANVIPKIGYLAQRMMGNLKYNKYFPKDVLKNKIIVIPQFSNAFLKAWATEDFAKYIERVEIRNFPHFYKQKILFSDIWSKTINEVDFQTIFYFSKKPKKGFLELYWS